MAKSHSTKPRAGSEPAAAGTFTRRKLLIGAGVVLVGIAVAVIAAMPKDQPAQPVQSVAAAAATGAGLRASESRFDFGSISMAAGNVTHTYRLSNESAEPLVIRKIYTSCMCTSAKLVKGVRQFGPFGMPGHAPIPTIDQTLAPGERAYIEVVFDPAAHGPAGVGPIERVVTVENSAQAPLQLAFSAQVRP